MRLLAVLIFVMLHLVLLGQEDVQVRSKEIESQGKKLYRSEMASWHGTDIFLEKFPQHRSNFSAYFSYEDTKGVHCIFYSKANEPKVLATISFDETFSPDKVVIDGTTRDFTVFEKETYLLRKAAANLVQTDSFFRHYNNTNFNIVPMVEQNEKKVYVLTGTSQQGVVMFGNDYLLTFDLENQLVSKMALHKSLIPIKYGKEIEGESIAAMHSHLPELGELITPTDICTLMLYQNLTKWKQHIVISKNFVSIWTAAENKLLTLSREAWEKIQGSK